MCVLLPLESDLWFRIMKKASCSWADDSLCCSSFDVISSVFSHDKVGCPSLTVCALIFTKTLCFSEPIRACFVLGSVCVCVWESVLQCVCVWERELSSLCRSAVVDLTVVCCGLRAGGRTVGLISDMETWDVWRKKTAALRTLKANSRDTMFRLCCLQWDITDRFEINTVWTLWAQPHLPSYSRNTTKYLTLI